MTSNFMQRGGLWVVAQSFLMLGNLLAPVWFRHDWAAGWSLVAGGGLLLVAAVFGLAGVAVLGRNRTMFPQPRAGSQLIQHGIYRWVRHPLYASVIGFAFGWGLCWRSRTAVLIAAVTLVFLQAKSEREERWLREMFADYDDYARRTKRFLPGLF